MENDGPTTPEPIPVVAEPGIVLYTHYDLEMQRHEVTCDLCGTVITLTGIGHPARLLQHHLASSRSGAQSLPQLLPVPSMASGDADHPPTRVYECPGMRVEWEAGSVWSTYPYHQHTTHALRWEPVAFENERWLRVRSRDCVGVISEATSVCPACLAVPTSAQFMKTMERAVSVAPHTPWLKLTYPQLHLALQKTTAQFRQLRLKYRNAERKLSTLRRRINDHQRLVMLLATNDVKRLRRLLSVALRKGASPRTLIARIESSLSGMYTPRGGFEDRDLDVAFLAKALGGPRLLYVLSHSHGLPSISTLRRQMTIPQLLPCISKPTEEEISTNIASLCSPECRPSMRPTVAGLILMVDGVALEERCRYSSERNSIIGLCREHSTSIRTRVTSFDMIKKVEEALHRPDGELGPRCCYGKDGTVFAVAPYARTDHYTPVPILLSPSCKCETGEELADTVGSIEHVWGIHSCGQVLHGDLWAVGSDGEASFRRMRFTLCMSKELDGTAPLGQLLHGLQGFNCYTGARGLVGTCDPKHVIKRFATLVRNPKGIMIHETLLMSHHVYEHLCRLPGMTAEKAQQLLDPVDKQNVPKAVNLLQSMLKLKDLTCSPAAPSFAHRHHVLSFLAETLGLFLLPFISVNMDLSDQIFALTTYAHLIAALWMRHRTKFITAALYADSQAIVKNIVITVARLQLVNRDLPFHIILEGTDRLEGLFGDCRTQDHSRNFDVQQLAEKLATSTLIQGIFERNPDLDSGHRRLSLKDAMGIDHVNPRSWKASVRVGDVELAAEWARGREEANRLLKAYFGASACVNFDVAFQRGSSRDLLRPLGDYVGYSHDPDDLRTDAPETESVFAREVHAPSDGARDDTAGMPADSDSSVHLPRSPMARTSGESDDDGNFDHEPEGVGIDDFLSRLMGGPAPVDSALIFSEDDFLEIEGKKYLKASVVTIFLTAKRSRKVTMRLLRVRGVTLEDLRGSVRDRFNGSDMDGADLVKSGDIAAALVRIGGVICLAVVEILEIHLVGEKKRRVTALELEEMEREDAHVQVLVQVLKMRPPVQNLDDSSTVWLWDHSYAEFEPDKKAPQAKTSQHTLIVPGPLLYPLGPSVVPVRDSESDSERQSPQAQVRTSYQNGSQAVSVPETSPPAQITWSLSDAQLREVLDVAWNALKPATDDIVANIELLPSASKSDALPYRNADGAELLVQDVPEHLTIEKLDGKHKVPCLLCGATMELSQMRNHQIGIEPCGFCGREERCLTRLSRRGGTPKVSSSCRYHYASMSYAAARRSTPTTPSTNVPIHCPFCPVQPLSGEPQTIWKYNAMTHLFIHHQNPEGRLPDIPPQFLVDMHISLDEEEAMGIGEEYTKDWRDSNEVPGSDDVEQASAGIAAEESMQKRARAQSTAEGGRRRKTVRTT
ncbi:hypothetical protein FKP32DRAFT_1649613 [Trametes sanguinea]|nr:hypothetical protein FKP32DRAFT_1649613 [Trametes sanguinea]